MKMRERASRYFHELQDRISSRLEELDGTKGFIEDTWEREEGGGGRTRAIEDGELIEKGGVNVSVVEGAVSEKLAEELDTDQEQRFFATGLSLILHHRSPHIPILHMNVRYFELSDGTSWFGGGIDITPIYVVPEDAGRFHRHLKQVCDTHDPSFYPRFKEWADEYFYLSHREETRGVGGIFFDRLSPEKEGDQEALFHFVQDIGNAFPPIYEELLEGKRNLPWNEREEEWQRIRRGRYVEFNLIHDRGTRFGLLSKGRTESILVSMPPHAAWSYRYEPEEGTAEAETLDWLKKGVDWVEH